VPAGKGGREEKTGKDTGGLREKKVLWYSSAGRKKTRGAGKKRPWGYSDRLAVRKTTTVLCWFLQDGPLERQEGPPEARGKGPAAKLGMWGAAPCWGGLTDLQWGTKPANQVGKKGLERSTLEKARAQPKTMAKPPPYKNPVSTSYPLRRIRQRKCARKGTVLSGMTYA